jgi:hypothetical protein
MNERLFLIKYTCGARTIELPIAGDFLSGAGLRADAMLSPLGGRIIDAREG